MARQNKKKLSWLGRLNYDVLRALRGEDVLSIPELRAATGRRTPLVVLALAVLHEKKHIYTSNWRGDKPREDALYGITREGQRWLRGAIRLHA